MRESTHADNQRREAGERRARIKWLNSQIEDVKRSTEECSSTHLAELTAARARMVLHRHTLDERKKALEKAVEAEALLNGRCEDLRGRIMDKM